jgi:PadR family transcriptional regulator, regulatory protein PadR
MGLTPVIDIYYKEVAMSDHLGRFEHFLLLTVMRLGEDAYGMTIRRELADHTGRDIAVGAIYTALARLERRGLVQSWLGEPTPERGGKAKRHYRVLAAGKKALEKAEAALTALSRTAGDHLGRT